MGAAENKIESAVCRYATNRGFLVRKYHSIGQVGGPDRIFYGHGSCFLIEFKALGEELDPPQEREINKIRAHGVKVFVCDDIGYGETVIDGAVLVGRKAGWVQKDAI